MGVRKRERIATWETRSEGWEIGDGKWELRTRRWEMGHGTINGKWDMGHGTIMGNGKWDNNAIIDGRVYLGNV